MDEFELKISLGQDMFDEGMRIVDAGGVSPCVEIAEGIFTFEVVDGSGLRNIVLKRVYPSKNKGDMYDCDCGSPHCVHHAAVFIFEHFTSETVETDQSTIDRIVGRIQSLVKDIVSDPDYDMEENHWKVREIKRFYLEPHNGEVEMEHVSDVLADIFDSVTDPLVTLELLDMMCVELRSMEYDNGGADDALRDYEDEIGIAASYADETVVARFMSSCDELSGPWIKRYLGRKYHSLERVAYDINLRKGDNGPYMRLKMLENRDYDELIECRGGNPDDIIAVVEHLARYGDRVRAGEYALRLLDVKDPSPKVVDTIYSVGLVREAATLYLQLFGRSERLIHLERAFESDEVERGPYLDKVLGYCKGITEYDPQVLMFLVKYGRMDDAVKVLESVGYRPRMLQDNIDFGGARALYHELRDKGYMDDAAKVLRYIIDSVLSANDNKNYEMIVMIIREMEADRGFENITLPHSKYMEGLRMTASKKRKFWAIYNGTYVKRSYC